MHLLFYGKEQTKVLHYKRVEELLLEQSRKVDTCVLMPDQILTTLPYQQGAIFDHPNSAASILSFIETYSIQTHELLEPDPSKYKTFNEFFYR